MSVLSCDQISDLTKSRTLFEWTVQDTVQPTLIKKAKGVYFWDDAGKKYLDLNAQAMCVNIGHGDLRVKTAIINQLDELAFVTGQSFITESRALLGKVLSDILPGDLTKSFFVSTGSEANEHAIKIARTYTKKHKILARYRSYHGATFGSISLTGDPRRWPCEPGMPGIVRVEDPYQFRCRWCKNHDTCTLDCLNQIEDVIRFENPNSIAAIIVEPVTGTNGIIIPPKGYLAGLRTLCDKYDILMIADEVMTGFGRTGKWFACDHWNVIPDLVTMAKGITSGYIPLGAVSVRDEIAAYFNKNYLPCGNTYNSHPVACAAALAVINVYKSDKLIENSESLGKILFAELKKIKEKHISVGDVRSIGLFAVIEFVSNRDTNEMLVPFNASSDSMQPMLEIKKYLFDKGIFVFIRWNLLFISPPLCISKEELLYGLNTIDEAIKIVDQYAS